MFSSAAREPQARRKRRIIGGISVLVLLLCRGSIFAQNSPPTAGFPLITRGPTNHYFNPGTNVVLEVQATSSLPVRIQWLFNDTPIQAATNAALVISNFNIGHVGFYCAQVMSAVGATASSQAFVSITTTNPVSVNFANGAAGVNAPVEYGGSQATLWAGPQPDALFPLATTSIATSGGSKGYFFGGARTIRFVPIGSSFFCLVTVSAPSAGYDLPSNLLQLHDPNALPGQTMNLVGLRFPFYPEWPEPAFFGTPSSNWLASAGQDVELRIHLFGYSAIHYRWKRNGIEIPDAIGCVRGHSTGCVWLCGPTLAASLLTRRRMLFAHSAKRSQHHCK